MDSLERKQGPAMPGSSVLCLGETDMEDGISYVVFSSATKLTSIGIEGGLPCNRFTIKIMNQTNNCDNNRSNGCEVR
jgi:hypothetical protein